MNINDLTNDQLNTLAAWGQGWEWCNDYACWKKNGKHVHCSHAGSNYDPCNDWNQAGELVEKYDIWTSSDKTEPEHRRKIASCEPHTNDAIQYAATTRVAAVRAFVASVYGTEIDFDAIVGGE